MNGLLELAIGALVSTTFVASVVVALVKYFSKARVQFDLRPVGGRVWSCLVRNFDARDIRDEVVLALDAPRGLKRVEVCAGPWFREFRESSRPDGTTRVDVVLHGLPGDGVVSLRLKTLQEGALPGLQTKSTDVVRDFGPMGNWFSRRWTDFAVRLVLGTVVGGVALFATDLALSSVGSGAAAWRGLPLVLVVLVSPLLLALSTVVSGKEVVPGYLGWSSTAAVWTCGPDAAEPGVRRTGDSTPPPPPSR